ncbi:MAG: hypothetical protein P8X48_03130 [Acidiferrobacteraceae bacterium]|jgi:hypothetical protein
MAHDPAKKPTQAPKHKPSTKHTLHEVLNSLQDVLNNELANDEDKKSAVAPETKSPNVIHSRSRDEVLSSLKALIGAAAAGEPLPRPGKRSTAASGGPSDIGEDLKPSQVARTPDSMDPEPETDLEDTVASPEEFHLEMEEPAPTQPVPEADPDAAEGSAQLQDTPPPKPARGRSRRGKPKQIEIGWDDIPVLNDVVAPPPEALDQEVRPEIRDIAIKVAAALNIELKRASKEALDVKMVMQLQSLLQHELVVRGLLDEHPGTEEDTKKDNDQ